MKLRNEEISLKESINELIKKEDNIYFKKIWIIENVGVVTFREIFFKSRNFFQKRKFTISDLR